MDPNDLSRARFRAAFPSIQSALKIGPDGMRVQLDIPESEMAEAVKLLQWRERVLIVTVEPEQDGERGAWDISYSA